MIEIQNLKKIRTMKPFYEYTSQEFDKLKNDIEKFEKRKLILPPILIRNQKSKSKIVSRSKEVITNKNIKFEYIQIPTYF